MDYGALQRPPPSSIKSRKILVPEDCSEDKETFSVTLPKSGGGRHRLVASHSTLGYLADAVTEVSYGVRITSTEPAAIGVYGNVEISLRGDGFDEIDFNEVSSSCDDLSLQYVRLVDDKLIYRLGADYAFFVPTP